MDIVIKEKKGFDWKITAKKFGITVLMAAGLAATSALIESLGTLSLPINSTETLLVGIGIAILKAVENVLKNRNK